MYSFARVFAFLTHFFVGVFPAFIIFNYSYYFWYFYSKNEPRHFHKFTFWFVPLEMKLMQMNAKLCKYLCTFSEKKILKLLKIIKNNERCKNSDNKTWTWMQTLANECIYRNFITSNTKNNEHRGVNDVTAAQSSRHDKYLHECTATAKIEQKSLWFLSTPSVYHKFSASQL